MSADPKQFFTLEQYFELQRTSEEKWEYWDGRVFCMSGGTQPHSDIGDNISRHLGNKLVGRGCRARSGSMPVKTKLSQPYKYPDASVACGENKFEKIGGIDVLINPVVIVEVLSPTTRRIDEGPKFTIYKGIDTFREYLLVSQDEPSVTRYLKQDNGDWIADTFTGIESSLYLTSIDCTLSFTEIYEGIVF